MPLQHAADAMLRRMRRGHGGARLRQLVERLRARVPGLVFRSAFIVGHPGETEAEFEELCEFVRWAELDRVGVFVYSDEETAHSYQLPLKIPRKVARARARKLMAIQRRISKRKNCADRPRPRCQEGAKESELVTVGRHADRRRRSTAACISRGEVLPGRMAKVHREGDRLRPPRRADRGRDAAPAFRERLR
jgi:ribosomal protein S12 methylthiotransferase